MKKISLVLPLLALAACGDAITYPLELEAEAAAASLGGSTPIDQIQIVTDGNVNGGRFTVIGPVSASVGKLTIFSPTPTIEQAEQKLRIEALELGAGAVINVSISDVAVCPLSWECRKATGTAVVFTN